MFTLEKVGRSLYHISLDTDEINVIVAEISRSRDLELHYRITTNALKPAARDQLTVFGQEQIALLNITERLLK